MVRMAMRSVRADPAERSLVLLASFLWILGVAVMPGCFRCRCDEGAVWHPENAPPPPAGPILPCRITAASCPTLPDPEAGTVIASGLRGTAGGVGAEDSIVMVVGRPVPGTDWDSRVVALTWTPDETTEADLGIERRTLHSACLACGDGLMGAVWIQFSGGHRTGPAFATLLPSGPPALLGVTAIDLFARPAVVLSPRDGLVVGLSDDRGVSLAFGAADGSVTEPVQVFEAFLNTTTPVAMAPTEDGCVLAFSDQNGGHLLRCAGLDCAPVDLDVPWYATVRLRLVDTPEGPFVVYTAFPGLWVRSLDGTSSAVVDLDFSAVYYEVAWAGDRFVAFGLTTQGNGPLVAASFDASGTLLDTKTLAPEATGHAPVAVTVTNNELAIFWLNGWVTDNLFDLLVSWEPCEP
jgi:hypothetical protein